MNARIEKERREKERREKEQEEEEERLKVGREQEVRNDERGAAAAGSMANKRSEVWGRRRQESAVVEESSEGCDDDIEIIGGNVPQTLNKTSYVQNWLKRGGEEGESNSFSDDDQLDESVEDLDKASTADNTAEDSFEKTGVESVVEGETGDAGSDVETSKRKRGPSKTGRAGKKSRKYCCGLCEGFKRANCDACSACMDKPRNGGPNKLKQKCSNRACSAQ